MTRAEAIEAAARALDPWTIEGENRTVMAAAALDAIDFDGGASTLKMLMGLLGQFARVLPMIIKTAADHGSDEAVRRAMAWLEESDAAKDEDFINYERWKSALSPQPVTGLVDEEGGG